MSLSKRAFEAQQEREAPAARLSRARERVRFAAHGVTVNEGRLLDYETAEEINRALMSAQRELEALTIQLSVMERQVQHG